MKRLRVAILSAVVVVVAALGALAGMLAWALGTEAGTAWLLAQLQARAPVPVMIGEVRGTLWRGLGASDLEVTIGADRLQIDDVETSIRPADLLQGNLTVDALAISQARYVRGPIDAGAAAGPIAIPITIRVLTAAVDQLVVTNGESDTVIGPLSFSAQAAGSDVVLDEVVASALGVDVRGDAHLMLADGLAIDANLDWATVRESTRYTGGGRIAGDWPVLAFEQELSAPVAASADGELRWSETPQATLRLAWTDLAWPGLDAARSPAGELELSGWLEAFEFEASGALVVDGVVSDVVASGSGTPETLTFGNLSLAGIYGELDASGRLDVEPLAWELSVDGRDLNPGVWLEQWPGALAVRGRLAGSIAPALELTLSELDGAGTLRDYPLTATGRIAYRAPNRWALDDLHVDVLGNRVQANGTIGTTLALDLSLDAPSLDAVWPEAGGAARLEARLGGTLERPEIAGFGRGTDFRFGDLTVGSLSVSGDIVADESRPMTLMLAAEDVVWRRLAATGVAGTVSGTAADHVVDFDIAAVDGAASLRATGAWDGQRWNGQVATLQIEEPTLGRWNLVAPVALAFGRGGLELGRACLAQLPASLCAESRIGTDADATAVELTAFDLSALNASLPEDLSLAGIYDARLSLSNVWPRPVGTLTTRGTGTVITIREIDAPPLELPIEALDANGSLSVDGLLRVDGALEGIGGARLTLDAEIVDLWSEAPVVAADFSGIWSDVGLLSALSPEIGEVTGSVNVEFALAGDVRSPDVRGQARWTGGQIEVPRWGFLLEDVDVEVASPDGSQLLIEATGRAGEGHIMVSGVTAVDPSAGWPTELRIFGDRLQAVRLPEADVVVSPALAVRAALPNIEVEGAFLIPHARLLLEQLPPQAARPSTDAVIHEVERPTQRRPLNVSADLRIGLGNDVRYTGAGLDVALTGAMGLAYESGQSAVASGGLNLNGVYQAYGQTLEIDRGQLLFTGPLDNPTLDVRAIRRIDTTTVGIQLTGTVIAPVSRVFSEPAMNEADALAYLLLGRPLSGSGAEDTAPLEAAAFAMGLQQAMPVIQRFGTSLGLDELTVQPTSADAGEIMAGKRLSPRLYVRYSYGLFNRIGGLVMSFSVTDRVSLETRSGDNRSMDLIYTLERD